MAISSATGASCVLVWLFVEVVTLIRKVSPLVRLLPWTHKAKQAGRKLDVREAAARLPDEGDAGEEIGDDRLEGDEPVDDAELDAEAEEIEG